MIFKVNVFEEGQPNNGFRSEVEANDFKLAIQRTSADLVEVYRESKAKCPSILTVVLTPRDFDIPPLAWRLDCTTSEYAVVEVPCGNCLGEGVVDSGGFDPQGKGIDIPCPSCHPELRAWQEAFGTSQLTHALAENQAYGKALTNFQNDTWASLNRYSNVLGWGLSGIQPECWTCLDMAVGELVQSRAILKELRDILMGRSDHPDPRAVVEAAKLIKDLYASSTNPRGAK